MTYDPHDWEGIRDAYVNGDWSLERICAGFNVSFATLRKHAKAGGWVRLIGTKPRRPGPKPCASELRPKSPREVRLQRRITVGRLLQAVDARLAEVEARMASGAGAGARSAADTERDTRTLGALTRLYAKLVELDEQAKETKKSKQGSASKEATHDAERFRQELALRLQRLNQTRNT